MRLRLVCFVEYTATVIWARDVKRPTSISAKSFLMLSLSELPKTIVSHSVVSRCALSFSFQESQGKLNASLSHILIL